MTKRGQGRNMNMLKVALLGITGVLLAIPLQKEKSGYSSLIAMGVCICLLFSILTKAETVVAFIERLKGLVLVDDTYIALILKMVGITYVAEFSMNVCKDAGYAAIANQIEVFAKISILAVSLPVFVAFLETIGGLI